MWQEVWSFETKRFRVALQLQEEQVYEYDGVDDDGQIKADLYAGRLVAFASRVVVFCDGQNIASDYLGGSVYKHGEEKEFWTAHRTSDYAGRNTLELKAKNCVICHYFPSMVAQAVQQARASLCNYDPPKMRCAA